MSDATTCEPCGVPIFQRPRVHGEPRRFCSERCQQVAANRKYSERHAEKIRQRGQKVYHEVTGDVWLDEVLGEGIVQPLLAGLDQAA